MAGLQRLRRNIGVISHVLCSLQDKGSSLFAPVREPVKGPGNGGDGNTAFICNIFQPDHLNHS